MKRTEEDIIFEINENQSIADGYRYDIANAETEQERQSALSQLQMYESAIMNLYDELTSLKG